MTIKAWVSTLYKDSTGTWRCTNIRCQACQELYVREFQKCPDAITTICLQDALKHFSSIYPEEMFEVLL